MYLEETAGLWKSQSVSARCDECGEDYRAKISTAERQMIELGVHQCRRCSSRRAGKKTAAKMSAIYSELYSGDGNPSKKPGVGEKISKALKGKPFSEERKKGLRKPKSRTAAIKEAANRPEEIDRRRRRMIENNPCACPEVRARISESISELMASGKFQRSLDKGWYFSQKTPRAIWCRSGLEKNFLIRATDCNHVEWIRSAEGIKIPYVYQGSTHNYLPDFLIGVEGGKVMIVEIKSTYFQTFAKSVAKADALISYGAEQGIDCFILNEKEIEPWLAALRG